MSPQVNLVVGDIFKVKGIFTQIIDEALEVVKWFNNHSRALGILRDSQHQLGIVPLALILPVLTRWTSHYLCVRRLLQLELAFKRMLAGTSDSELISCAGQKAEPKQKAREILDILKQYDFWYKLDMYDKIGCGVSFC